MMNASFRNEIRTVPVGSAYEDFRQSNPRHISFPLLSSTESVLQRVISAHGLTFWGQAAALIFSAEFAANPLPSALAPEIPALTDRRATTARLASPRRIMCDLPPAVSDMIDIAAARWKVGRHMAAALILHQAARTHGPALAGEA